jgi:hypothetical protein
MKKYFEIYVNGGLPDNGSSYAVCIPDWFEGMNNADVVAIAIDKGIIDDEDIRYVDYVKEIDESDYEKYL